MSDSQATTAPRRGHPDTTTIFVLGLLSLIILPVIFGPLAWYFGNRLLAKYDAEPGRWGHRAWVQAGVIMGIIGTVLGALIIVAVVILAVFTNYWG